MDETGFLLVCGLVLLPAAVMVWLSPRWRVACFLLGLGLALGTLALIHGPHDSMVALILVGGGLSLAALLVEIPAFAIRTIRKRRPARGDAARGRGPGSKESA